MYILLSTIYTIWTSFADDRQYSRYNYGTTTGL